MFTTDSRTERFLDSLGVKWTYTNDLHFSQLAPGWAEKNLGRSEIRIDAAIREYGLLMDRGSAAPAPIFWHNPTSKWYELLDGLQRLLAEHERNASIFSGYVVNTDSAVMVLQIRVLSNYRLQGGYQESSEWTLSQAIMQLGDDGSLSLEEIAAAGGWAASTVRDKKQCMDTGFAIRSIGGPEKLPDSILRIISKHAERADYAVAWTPVADFCNDVKRMKMSADEAEPYIEQFFSVSRNKGDLYRQFSKNLEEFHEDDDIATRLADPNRRRYQPMTSEGRLLKSLKAALTTAENVRDSRESIPYIEEYFQFVGKIRKVIQEIQSRGKRR